MFGKPDWFRAKSIGWGLTPTRWQGWAYTAAWATAITGPCLLLLSTGERLPEAGVWLALSVGALVWDVRSILKAMNPQAATTDNVLYIGDDQADSTRLTTRNYDLQVRK